MCSALDSSAALKPLVQRGLGGSHLRPGAPSPKPSRPPAAPSAPSLSLWCLLPTGLSPAPPGAPRGALPPGSAGGEPRPRAPGARGVARFAHGHAGLPVGARPWGAPGVLVPARHNRGASAAVPASARGLGFTKGVFSVLIAALERISARFGSPHYCVF